MSHSDRDIEARDAIEDDCVLALPCEYDPSQEDELRMQIEGAKSALETLERTLIHADDRAKYYGEPLHKDFAADLLNDVRYIQRILK